MADKTELGGKAAFPRPYSAASEMPGEIILNRALEQHGMTHREALEALAMHALIVRRAYLSPENVREAAVEYANAMLANPEKEDAPQ